MVLGFEHRKVQTVILTVVTFGPSPVTPASETPWWGIYALVLWVVAGIVIARYGEDLVRKPKQPALGYAATD